MEIIISREKLVGSVKKEGINNNYFSEEKQRSILTLLFLSFLQMVEYCKDLSLQYYTLYC